MNTNFIVVGLARRGIEPECTVSVADVLFPRSLIGYVSRVFFIVQRTKTAFDDFSYASQLLWRNVLVIFGSQAQIS